jgi:hypothetical protein
MKIKPITKYPFNGKEFLSLKEHSILGEEVIDAINRKIDIRHKDLFVLLDIICSKDIREVLVKSLTVTYYNEELDKDCNVLDLK